LTLCTKIFDTLLCQQNGSRGTNHSFAFIDTVHINLMWGFVGLCSFRTCIPTLSKSSMHRIRTQKQKITLFSYVEKRNRSWQLLPLYTKKKNYICPTNAFTCKYA
jgi:hypothetical protein